MNSLPYELLKIIVDGLSDRKDLLHIRAVNKTFCALATPCVFARLSTTGAAEDAIAIREVVRRKPLAECVKYYGSWPQDMDSELYLSTLHSCQQSGV